MSRPLATRVRPTGHSPQSIVAVGSADDNDGTLSLADVIPAAIEDSYCDPYPPPA